MIPELEAIKLPASEKVDFLLVYLGQKPATNFRFTQEFRHPNRPPVRPDQKPFDALVAWASRTGLPHFVEARTVNPAQELFKGTFGEHLLRQLKDEGKNIDLAAEIAENNQEDRITLYLAMNQAWLEAMRRADREGDEHLMGQCFGFPPNAIEAYVADKLMPGDEQKALSGSPEVRAFAMYRVSQASPEADLETARRWAAAVKAASPAIYHQLVS